MPSADQQKNADADSAGLDCEIPDDLFVMSSADEQQNADAELADRDSEIPDNFFVSPCLDGSVDKDVEMLALGESMGGLMPMEIRTKERARLIAESAHDIPETFFVLDSDDMGASDAEEISAQFLVKRGMRQSGITELESTISRDPAGPIAESAHDIPETFFVLDSDDLGASNAEVFPAQFPVQRGMQPTESESIISRDPVSGWFTEDSFTSFVDRFMD